MKPEVEISVVIPTFNRKDSLLSLLQNLNDLQTSLLEVIIVDAGTQRLTTNDIDKFKRLPIQYLESEASVCVQRNKGITVARGEWIFLCDDDLELTPDYLSLLLNHANQYPAAGAISGLVLQKDTGIWMEQFPIDSALELWRRFIFQLSIWGEISGTSFFSASLKRYYGSKGNHLSKAGWPVLTDFSGAYFKTPVYGLGASLVKTSWLRNSLYDEILDPHGIGDNYGVAAGFPPEGIHVVKLAYVYHHKIEKNRLQESIQYYRRGLALHYFNKKSNTWLVWSLIGNLFSFLILRKRHMISASIQLLRDIITRNNPYVIGRMKGKRIVIPMLNNLKK